jgi:hypothetical protein
MSDHWNSLANLLGTPSLAPQRPKGDPTGKRTPEAAPPAGQSNVTESIQSETSGNIVSATDVSLRVESAEPSVAATTPTKGTDTKGAEKSKLRSSWDAVASFFGVSSPAEEAVADQVPPKQTVPPDQDRPRESATKDSRSFKKGPEPRTGSTRNSDNTKGPESKPASSSKKKPSFWETEEPGTDVEPPSERHAIDGVSKPVASGDPSDSNTESSRRDDQRRTRASQEPREKNRRDESFERDSMDSSPDRRSHRRPPRRGSRPDEDSPNERERSEVKRSEVKRSEVKRSEEKRSEEKRSEGEREETRRSSTRESRSQPIPKAERKSSSRHESGSPDARPTKASSFGAGIAPRETSRFDDFDSDRDDRFESDSFENEVDSDRSAASKSSSANSRDENETEERSRRRRRRGGRGRSRDQDQDAEASNRDERSDDRETSSDIDPSEDDARLSRNIKVPSWNETIGVLVEANILNHQRAQSSHRGAPRGRGRR